ncbi:MAG TPA: glycosyltransferase family 2 protein [Candidatus Saccharimonadales bacterium]|nr:glycosyltransferase family 2 protein [Candidatus Saccharimonadales bacterium]
MNKNKRVSIVIPVYNEEERLGACLHAIAAQTVEPFEVIVVDNNSTDNTAAVARLYPFVAVLQEKRQGVVYARTTGFNAASGDIIGRIDADTVLAPDWVESLEQIFSDKGVDAVSGAITYHDLPNRQLFGKVELFFRSRIAKKMGDEVFLYGANMAIRKSAWRKARPHLCNAGGMHEDFDLAIHAEEAGAHVVFDKSLRADVSLRRFDTNIRDFWQYALLNPRTYKLHGRKSQRAMYTVIFLVLAFYWALKIMHRGYDTETGRFSWQKVFASTVPRVNPATFVD